MEKKNEIRLRAANQDDCEILFHWANDELVRKNSLSKEPITWQTHQKWLKDKLKQPEITRIFIAELCPGQSIGQIRFDRDQKKAIISYSIDNAYRGKKLAVQLFKKGIENVILIWSDLTQITGIIKPENKASIKIFENNGFIMKRKGSLLEYNKSL